jgi:serine/threonine protein kinase
MTSKYQSRLSVGQVINHKWKLLETIGQGAFGEIFRCECIAIPRGKRCCVGMHVAVKVERDDSDEIEPDLPPRRTALRIEAIVLKKLQSNPQVPRYYEFGSDPDLKINYLCMELLGPSLMQLRRLVRNNRFSHAYILSIGLQVLLTLWKMHDLGVLHRDIKPSNIVVGRSCDLASRKVNLLKFLISI